MNDEALKILKSALRDTRITSQEDSEQWTALQKIRAIDKLIKVYTLEFEEMLEKYEELESEWNLLKPQIQEALSKWNELEPKIETAIDEWDTFKPMIEELMDLWSELYPTITALLSEWEELKPEIESALSEWDDFKPQVQTIINDWQTIQPQWIYIKNEWDDVKAQIQSLFDDWEEMQEQFSSMMSSWSNIQTTWTGYQSTWSTMQTQWSSMQDTWSGIINTWDDIYLVIMTFENMIRNISLNRISLQYVGEGTHTFLSGGSAFVTNRIELYIKEVNVTTVKPVMTEHFTALSFTITYDDNTTSYIDISEIIAGTNYPTTTFYPSKLSCIKFECHVVENVSMLTISFEDMKGQCAVRRTVDILSSSKQIKNASITMAGSGGTGRWLLYGRY